MAEHVFASQIETSVVFLQEKVEKVRKMACLPPFDDPVLQVQADADAAAAAAAAAGARAAGAGAGAAEAGAAGAGAGATLVKFSLLGILCLR